MAATDEDGEGGPATRPPLTRERVLGAAVALADEEGIGAVTMRALARRLGVEAMSLYHHVAGKEQILDGMVDLVFGEVDLPRVGAPWRPAMRARAASARDVLGRHPWATPLLDSRTAPGPATLLHHDRVLGCLRADGFSLVMAAHAVALLDSYVYGFATQEAALPGADDDGLAEAAAEITGGLDPDTYPHLVEMAADHVLRPGYSFGDEFAFGLELVLEGLERALDAG
ncbi:TetR/AcrR family transcriptional regulator [Iamia majanohamensis]|uniref:TetR/AcrR family transcriptional regulator n=1 Tax=Iamia majanohamensis TaxID=467976 RepID=A0AAE9Y6I4_9ACTN|nr:TetR/AcrR family transcriptional regulator [Iamia majanohamensis]WCO67594.1 TetR/AcrR family transcriptional regulator [Iamia majanohamensis]